MNRNAIIASLVIAAALGFAGVVAVIIHHNDQGMEHLGDRCPSPAPALHQDNETVLRQETRQRPVRDGSGAGAAVREGGKSP